jgi:hypothetical protein
MSTTGLIENERVLAKDCSRFTFKLYIARSVYGSKDSMQHLVAFRDQNPRNQELEKLYISSNKRARGNINFQRNN